MIIHLPEDLENSIRSLVRGGRYSSEDEVIAEAVRSFLNRPQSRLAASGLGSIGAMRDDAELLDQAVEHAMKVREERPWRLGPGE